MKYLEHIARGWKYTYSSLKILRKDKVDGKREKGRRQILLLDNILATGSTVARKNFSGRPRS